MCITVEVFDSKDYDIELVHAGLLNRTANAILETSQTSTTSCFHYFSSEPKAKSRCKNVIIGSPMMPEAFDLIDVQIQIPIDDNNINPTPQQGSNQVKRYHTHLNTTSLQNLSKNTIRKLKVISARSEGFREELLITLVGVTGQNAMQLPGGSTSYPIIRCIAMAANGMAFILLLTGVLLRSNQATRREDRRRVASNMLVMLGIVLTAAGPMLNMFTNTPNVGRYVVPLVFLLPIVGVFT